MRPRARQILAIVSLALAAAACEEQDYHVVVHFADDALAERADRIELALLGSCDDVVRGAPPPPDVPGFVVEAGVPPAAFGEVDPGRRGLYARASDDDTCAVVAAGCTEVELEEGGGGDLEVTIDATGELGCPGGTRCVGGGCMLVNDVDAGPRPDAGAGVDAGPPTGQAWVDLPCSSEGAVCAADMLRRIYGTCRDDGAGPRCCAGCYDPSTQRCEPGWTDARCGWFGMDCASCEPRICFAVGEYHMCQ